MKMKRRLLRINIFVFLIFLASCKPSPHKAEKYYDSIISPVEEVFAREEALVSIVNNDSDTTGKKSPAYAKRKDSVSDEEFAKMTDMAFYNLQTQIVVSKNKLELLPDFDKSDQLKKTALELMDVYTETCQQEYAELINIVKISQENFTLEDDDRLLELSEIIDTKIQKKTEALIKELKLFARKYNFEIKNDSIEKTLPNE